MAKRLENFIQDIATVVVTGGSSGIGKAFIRQFHRLDRSLVICNLSRTEPRLHLPGADFRHYPCDLVDLAKTKSICRAIVEDLPPGKLLLINNSGFGSYGEFPGTGLGGNLAMVDVNVRAVVALTGYFLPVLRERGGAIVNVASTAAFQPTPFMATYGASKAFILHWSLALERDLASTGIGVLALCPGPTTTEFFRIAGSRERVVSPALSQTAEEVVDITLNALSKGKTMCVCGWKNRFLAAAASFLPKRLAARIAAVMLRKYRLVRSKEPDGR